MASLCLHRIWWSVALAASIGLVAASWPALPDLASAREVLTAESMMAGVEVAAMPVDNSEFTPSVDAGSPRHEIEGRITVPRSEMRLSSHDFSSYRFFPGFSVGFFSYDGFLVPVTRSLITDSDDWSLILSPGRIWSEPDDLGMSRASFPFALASPPDRLYAGGEAHNGVAMFLIGEDGTSDMYFQITQEIAPDGDIFDMWGALPLEYEPGSLPDLVLLQADFDEELADKVDIRSWAELEGRHDPDELAALTADLPPEEVSAAGLVVDGDVYLQPSRTRYGEYPYPAEMQHGVMSVSKSIGAGIAMLWLAQEYGPQVFDLRIVDYLDVDVGHNGWDDVTFGDVLDMATGIGDNSPERDSYDVDANESGPSYRHFYLAQTTHWKLDAALSERNYPWGPGEVLRYTSAQTFVLAAAMDALLKSEDGPDAHLWERLNDAVFRPIGIHHMTMIQVPDDPGGPGIPLLASGLRLTVDHLAKIVTLLQNGGSYDGQQLLHPALVDEALYRTGQVEGLPSGKQFDDGDQAYHMSFWSLPHRSDQGGYFQIPFMSGAGGNTIFLAPNGVSTFVLTDHGTDAYSLNSPSVAESIRPFPGAGLSAVDLMDDPGATQRPIRIMMTVVAVGAFAVAVLAMRRRHRRRRVHVHDSTSSTSHSSRSCETLTSASTHEGHASALRAANFQQQSASSGAASSR